MNKKWKDLGLRAPTIKKKVKCGRCGDKFTNMKGLKSHNKSVHKGLPLKVAGPRRRRSPSPLSLDNEGSISPLPPPRKKPKVNLENEYQ